MKEKKGALDILHENKREKTRERERERERKKEREGEEIAVAELEIFDSLNYSIIFYKGTRLRSCADI